MEEKVFLKNKSGFKIAAIFSKPEAIDSHSIVIMCHGLDFSKNSRVNNALKKIFLENQIATFELDFFGHGDSQGNKEDANLNEFVDNVLISIEYTKKLKFKNIGIYGASIGAVISVLAASKTSDLKVMALKAPGMGQTTRKMSQYKEDFDTKSWIKVGIQVKTPTLIIQGTSDEKVEVELTEQLSHAIKNSELRLYADADHFFTKKEDFDGMVCEISDFIIKNIC